MCVSVCGYVCESAVTVCTWLYVSPGCVLQFFGSVHFLSEEGKGASAPCKTLDIALAPCLAWHVASHRPYLKSNRVVGDGPCVVLKDTPGDTSALGPFAHESHKYQLLGEGP